ncbi:MAG TPA: hypothetical protein VG205_00440 [Acidimicrobiales bacterium]|nr:hypothetical protein [Acidimicrobiales bacterium]
MSADLIGARYQLHRELARTPSVAVYEADDRQVGAPAAVAMEVGRDRGAHDGRRLLGRRVARTTHPHLVSADARGKDRGRAFVAFRPPARNLATELEAAPYPAHRVAQMGVDLGSALAVLHRSGARLGSLHPGHVGIDADGAVRLSPWPLAAAPGGWGGQGAWSPPEIVAGGAPTVAGDIWSLGAVLLSSLVGTGPGHLSDDATAELADRLRHDANPALVDAIGRSMVNEPSRRFTSASGLAAALDVAPTVRRPVVVAGVPRLLARTRGLAVGSAGVVAVLSATSVGVALSSIGASHAIGGGGTHHPAATAAGPPASTPPSSVAGPHGSVALAAPPATTAAPTARVPSTTGTRTAELVATATPNSGQAAATAATPTTSPPLAPISTATPVVTAGPVITGGSAGAGSSGEPASGNSGPGHGSGGHGPNGTTPGNPTTTTTTSPTTTSTTSTTSTSTTTTTTTTTTPPSGGGGASY